MKNIFPSDFPSNLCKICQTYLSTIFQNEYKLTPVSWYISSWVILWGLLWFEFMKQSFNIFWHKHRGCVSGVAGGQCIPIFQKWRCFTPIFWRKISTDFLNDRRMNNFGDNKYELPSMQQQYNRKVSIIVFVVSISKIIFHLTRLSVRMSVSVTSRNVTSHNVT